MANVDTSRLSGALAEAQEWVSLEQLSQQVGASVESIDHALEPLKEKGFVLRERDYAYVTESGRRYFEYSKLVAR